MDPFLTEFIKGREFKGFKPVPYYSEAGDFLTFFIEDQDHHALRMDDVLTVYKSNLDGHVVGFKLKGISVLAKRAKKNSLEVHEDGILKVQMLLIAGQQEALDHVEALKIYQYFLGPTGGLTLPVSLQSDPDRKADVETLTLKA